ncbi:MAG: MarR family transcriptional regulator [Gammaproteobacteria bacterium]|jgi:DNA-binding MarR family transcriptional regulator|nr:MarR family transcriptional regulator [Gammaproteobacteria bacterium]MBU0786408.1 MarR family transcriptional regulator [Gammaproteobacteria bacterium]MBU0813594.1 MarR family transcriptional regulator [Gammaproteobacteria bacterium]MBU1788935.1 MarR family transcriptional regulator [Gammaproteobacteria bacterium]
MENPDPRVPKHLSELLNFRLQRLHALSGAPVIRILEGRHGITRREWRLLAWLAEMGPLSPSDLALSSQLDRARTSRAIGSLVNKGLVNRTLATHDPRRALVALTPEGQSLYAKVFPEVAHIHAQLVEVLDDAQLQTLDTVLALLTAHARTLNERVATDIKAQRQAGGSRRLRSG